MVLVLTDVQGSTRLWQDEPAAMDRAMARHHEIVHGAVAEHGGWRPADQGEGDAVFAAFASATSAVAAVVQVQRDLAAEKWPTSVPLRVRIGVHVGEVTERDGNLYGDAVNRCARLRGLGSGGQTLLSAPVFELVRDKLPAGVSVRDLGEHRMKDLIRPEHIWQLDVDGLAREFPPLSSLDRVLHNLPVQASPLIGRDEDLARVLTALSSHRLVTLTGFGGMGKTRLALQAGAELADGDADGVWFVDLASTTDPAAVPAVIGRATGLGGSDADSVVSAITGQRLLLILDNLEQVMGCAPFVAQLLQRVPGVSVLATSREPLHIGGEQELPLAPLALPPTGGPQDAQTLGTYAAVRLFVDRARAARPDFSVTNDTAPAVAAICQRLDGHPLAIELAAARVRMMTPQALLPRLDSALTVLTGGRRDLPDRQQTLRATIAWSYDLLEPDERLLLERMSVFPGATTYEHLDGVCGDGLDVFASLGSLVDKSLVRVLPDDAGQDRYGLLASIRAYAAEHLAAADQAGVMRERHSSWFRQLLSWPTPATRLQQRELENRVLADLDDLDLAWSATRDGGDRRAVSSFPLSYADVLDRAGDVQRAVAVAWEIYQAGPADLTAFRALAIVVWAETTNVVPVLAGRSELLDQAAAALDRPDTTLFALWCGFARQRTAAERLDLAARAQALAAEPVPADSPWPADLVPWVADKITEEMLEFVDPPRARAAAERCWRSPGAGPWDVALYGWTLHESGLHRQALGVLWPLVAQGVTRQDPVRVHWGACTAASALLALDRTDDALAAVEPWRAEVARRDWPSEKRRHLSVHAWALLQQGEVEQAADLVAAHLPISLLAVPTVPVLRERTERLAGRLTDLARLRDLIDERRPHRFLALDMWLCLAVEQALRVDGAERAQLLDEIVAERRGLYLPFGYQEDLDELLGAG
ncbi:MAG TPA: adenylate/guanylate cyclase domain-containing protein [Mycobacteriales bacterium]|nr:adenylate/guanylate cyclase domain-containing protein [Mycobacteriales bacterium]